MKTKLKNALQNIYTQWYGEKITCTVEEEVLGAYKVTMHLPHVNWYGIYSMEMARRTINYGEKYLCRLPLDTSLEFSILSFLDVVWVGVEKALFHDFSSVRQVVKLILRGAMCPQKISNDS